MGSIVVVALGLVAAGALGLGVFAVAVFFMALGQALRLATVVAMAGMIGFAITALVQAPFYPAATSSSAAVTVYLGTAGVAGLAMAAVAGWIALRLPTLER